MISFTKLATIVALGLTLVLANNCGGNCPSNKCDNCVCGTDQKRVNIASACSQYGGWSQRCCQCIVQHESDGNSHAILRNDDGKVDVGLWQIDSVNWGQCNGGRAPCDVGSNLNCAKQIYQWGGNNWSAWSTCGACGCCGGRLEEEERIRLEATESDLTQ
eukprot:403339610